MDANILFAALLRDGTTRRLLLDTRIVPIVPEFLFLELTKHERYLLRKTRLPPGEARQSWRAVIGVLTVIPDAAFAQHYPLARQACPDPDDVPYFALALALDCPFWTNEAGLERQEIVRIVRTSELVKTLT